MRPTLVALFLGIWFVLAIAMPAQAIQFFEGNIGVDGHWLHVLDAKSLSTRVYWYHTSGPYALHVANDEAMTDVVWSADGVTDNYATPVVGAGFYYIQVVDHEGSSEVRALEVLADHAPPVASILHFEDGLFEIEVSDDTVLRLVKFYAGGVYVGARGLMTYDKRYHDLYGKLRRSDGVPRMLYFEYDPPKRKGKGKGRKRSALPTIFVEDVLWNATMEVLSQ